MKPAIFHAEAKVELRAATKYYEEQRKGLGRDFRIAVEVAIERIQRTPQAFTPYGHKGARKCLVRRFPYTIYSVELDDSIWIGAVAHQRRKPGYWFGRSPQ